MAGRRPAQPDSERKYFHCLWKENFRNSEVTYEKTTMDGNEKRYLRRMEKNNSRSSGGVDDTSRDYLDFNEDYHKKRPYI
jgi:hypothetical protein